MTADPVAVAAVPYTDEELARAHTARHLLPDPGPEVVGRMLATIEADRARTEQLLSAIRATVAGLRVLDGLTGTARERQEIIKRYAYAACKALNLGDVGYHPLDALWMKVVSP